MQPRPLRPLILASLAAVLSLIFASLWLPHVPLSYLILCLLPVLGLLVNSGLRGSHQERIRNWLGYLVGEEVPTQPTTSRAEGWGWFLAGLGVLVIALVMLERMQPFYFTQDDNLIFNPPIIAGCQSLEHGIFPTWNPCQFMGQPTSNQSDYVLTYPLTYVAYGIAQHLLGNPFLFTDVFCILHLLLGYGAIYWAARSIGMGAMLASLAGLCVVLSGCNLIMGRSYFHMTPVLLWMPLLVVALSRWQKTGSRWQWVLGTGTVVGLSCHSGNGQMWVYEVCFFLLVAALWVGTGALTIRRALWAVPALLLGVAIAAPLMWVQMRFVAGLPRAGGYGNGIARGWLAMLLPFPLARAAHPNDWGSTNLRFMGEFYYSGTLFVVACAVAGISLLGLLLAARCDAAGWKKIGTHHCWLIMAGAAFELALGQEGILWPLSTHLPLFKWFTGPFKFLLFLNLFMALGGGVVLERYLRQQRLPPRFQALVAVTVWGLLLYHVALTRPSFYSYADQPYPPLPPPLAQALGVAPQPTIRAAEQPGLGTQRLIPFAPERSVTPHYLISLMHALPTAYNVFSTDGYDLFVELTPPDRLASGHFKRDAAAAARAYGVRWLVVHRLAQQPVYGPNPHAHFMEHLAAPRMLLLHELQKVARPKLVLPDITLWELPHPDPLAFVEGEPQHALPIRFNQNAAQVDVSRLTNRQPTSIQSVVVNILYRPNMQATVDGHLAPLAADKWGRAVVKVVAGTRQLEVRYLPPWREGLWYGAVLAAMALLLTIGLGREPSRIRKDATPAT